MNLTVKDLLQIDHLAAPGLHAVRTKSFTGVSTDTRAVKKGQVFFALRGERFDGHTFIADAFRKGILCAVVDEKFTPLPEGRFLIVRDTVQALGQLAGVYRKKFSIPVLAVAGSNGKTTSKEMIAAVLGRKFRVLATEGNLNNQIGVPQTLFRLKPKDRIAVVEIGSNHKGEIRNLCSFLRPTHGLLTNISREHLEYFRDLAGVEEEEGELFRSLGPQGVALVNADDDRVVRQSRAVKKKFTFGFRASRPAVRGTLATVRENGCAELSVRPRGVRPFTVRLRVPGRHAALNALAAAAVGIHFRVPPAKIRSALERFTPVGKRMEIVRAGEVTILNDTYNANPDSVAAALETLAAMKPRGKKVVILADMLELGDASRREHEAIGDRVTVMGFEYLLTFGEQARWIHDRARVAVNVHYDAKNVLAEYAAELLVPGDVVLVKGSRGMRMEDVVAFLVERLGRRAA